MQKLTRSILAALVCASCSTAALAKDVTVMISGGFKAALEKLAPEYEAQSGDKIILVSGPSMGKTPQAIPARLARGEQADVLIMVGDALTQLEKERWTQPGSRVELADSPIGMVVKQGAPKPVSSTDAKALGQEEAERVYDWVAERFLEAAPEATVSGDGATGTYDPETGAFVLEWTSYIEGGPFNGFTGLWHLEGVFEPAERAPDGG